MLTEELDKKYQQIRPAIINRLSDFAAVRKDEYFYELCFCICTPQSKAKSALAVQEKLMKKRFRENPFETSSILSNPEHYIRFHNQKAKRLIEMREQYQKISDVLNSDATNEEKRKWLKTNVKGIGMKEASHFLRNIGCRGLGILDRHILSNLKLCDGIKEIPKLSSEKDYLKIEIEYKKFAEKIKIDIDELDLLFWYDKAGEIIK